MNEAIARAILNTPKKFMNWLNQMEKAMSGDMVAAFSPTSFTQAEGSTGWTKTVKIQLKSSDGKIHKWFRGTGTISIGDTSSAGTASISPASTATFVNGEAEVVITGSAAAWSKGVKQVETIQVTHVADSAGTITMQLTAAGMTGSPISTALEVEASDTAAEVATKIVAALAAVANIAAKFDVSVTGAGLDVVTVTSKTYSANDATLAFAFTDTDTTGVTCGSSTNATAGVAAETATLTLSNMTIMGGTVTGGTCVGTIIAAS